MDRTQQIKDAQTSYIISESYDALCGFSDGARWADSNPSEDLMKHILHIVDEYISDTTFNGTFIEFYRQHR